VREREDRRGPRGRGSGLEAREGPHARRLGVERDPVSCRARGGWTRPRRSLTDAPGSRSFAGGLPRIFMTTSSDNLQEPLQAAFQRLESQVPDFERRAGQLEMARLWSEALERGGVLAVEAPTGIGKSLAYLIPALLLRIRGSGPIVVSTYTKAL